MNQRLEAIEGVGFVLLLGAVLLGLNDDNALFSNAAVVEVEQALFVEGRQGRGVNIEAQVNSGGYFVHVLAPRPLGANGAQLNVAEGNGGAFGDLQHQQRATRNGTGR